MNTSLMPRLLLGLLLALVILPAPNTAIHASEPVSATLAPAPATVDSPVVAWISYRDAADLNELARHLDIWEVNHAQQALLAKLTPKEYERLRQAGYHLQIDAEKTAQLHEKRVASPGQLAGIPGYACYRTVEETYASLTQLEANYPTLVTRLDIGDSWDKVHPSGPAGYDLYVLRLTNKSTPDPKPVFFLMGAIHAREYATAELATRFAEYLLQNYGTDPDITWLLDYNEVHILPNANPDGRKWAEQGWSWRKNTDDDDGCSYFDYGTDLNRNSGFKWGGAGTDPCDATYQGPSATSEPETQAVQSYVHSIFADQRGSGDNDPAPDAATGIFITLHSYGRQVLFPWGWTASVAPNQAGLRTLARKLSFFNSYEACQAGDPACEYVATGTTDDWAYGILGVAACTFEVGTQFFQDCSSFESSIWPQNLAALLYAFKAARRPYTTPSGPEVVNVIADPATVKVGDVFRVTARADDTRYYTGSGAEPTQNVAAARYSVDVPSWVTGVISYPLEAADGVLDATIEDIQAAIDTTNWTPGRHTVFLEAQDADGNWGVPSALFSNVLAYPLSLSPTTAQALVAQGESITYTLHVTNTGTVTDTYTVAVTGHQWPTTYPASLGPLGPAQDVQIEVNVEAPLGTPNGARDTATVTVTSQREPAKSRTAVLITTAGQARFYLPSIEK